MSLAASAGIEVEGLVREFKNGPRAVDGIHLQVAPGEIYGFLGPNGAGKSTTVLMLTTLLPPTAGTARVAGPRHPARGPGGARRRSAPRCRRPRSTRCSPARDHMRLQTSLQGAAEGPAPRARRRADRARRAHRRRRPQGRRLLGRHEAPARPRARARALAARAVPRRADDRASIPSSRADLWAEVARLAREDGVTVFLTTQYLEEADVLADRVGIIDAGHIVAEGTPESLKAEIGRPSVEATPADRADRDAVAEVLSQLRLASCPRRPGAAAVRLQSGEDLVAVVRALDAADLRVADLQLHQPSLDDVFLAKTGRKLDADDADDARGGRRLMLLAAGLRDGAALDPADAAPAGDGHPADPVPADPDGDQRGRARRGDQHPRLPAGRQLSRLRDRVPVHPGLAVRVDQRRQRGRARRRDRLPESARADADAARRAAAREPLGRDGRGADLVADLPGGRASRPACTSRRASCGVLVLLVLGAADRAGVRVARARSSGCGPGSGEAVQGVFPLFFVFLFLSSSSLPRDADRAGLVPDDRHLQPDLVPVRGPALADHLRLAGQGAGARASASRRRSR